MAQRLRLLLAITQVLTNSWHARSTPTATESSWIASNFNAYVVTSRSASTSLIVVNT